MFRNILYAFEALLLTVLWFYGADIHLDFRFGLYLTATLVADLLIVWIRRNPGVVTHQLSEKEMSEEEHSKPEYLEVYHSEDHRLGGALKMKELQKNLLEPEVSLRSPYNIKDMEDDDYYDDHDRVEAPDRYGSVETLKDGQYSELNQRLQAIQMTELTDPICQNEGKVVRSRPVRHFCRLCNNVQNFRTKHCKLCKGCIAKFDHHCYYTGTLQ